MMAKTQTVTVKQLLRCASATQLTIVTSQTSMDIDRIARTAARDDAADW